MRVNVRFSEVNTKIDVDFAENHSRFNADFGAVTELRSPELEAKIRAEGYEAGRKSQYDENEVYW